MEHGSAPTWSFLIPLLFIGLAIFRNARGRRLRISRLWVAPSLVLFGVVMAAIYQPRQSALAIGADVVALALGVGLGWWRARSISITIDPATHELTSRTSPLGMILLLAIFGVRYLMRGFAEQHAALFHMTVMEITDVFLALALGLVCAQRLELWLRARAMLADARAAKAA